jgi:hypothetical protein
LRKLSIPSLTAPVASLAEQYPVRQSQPVLTRPAAGPVNNARVAQSLGQEELCGYAARFEEFGLSGADEEKRRWSDGNPFP